MSKKKDIYTDVTQQAAAQITQGMDAIKSLRVYQPDTALRDKKIQNAVAGLSDNELEMVRELYGDKMVDEIKAQRRAKGA